MVVQYGKIEGVKWAVGPSDLFLDQASIGSEVLSPSRKNSF